MRATAAIGLGLALMATATTARAQDRFEIQVYDADTAPPAGVGVETHVNHTAAGTTQAAPDGEAATEHQTHLTFEPHVGVAGWCELGAYFQFEFDADGTARWAGFKGRLKARLPRRYVHELLGLALNVELSVIPARFEPNVLGSELRPIIDVRWRWLYASLNPIVGFDLMGVQAGRPQLEPAAKVAFTAVEGLAFGLEYYSALGPVTEFYPVTQQTHRLFA